MVGGEGWLDEDEFRDKVAGGVSSCGWKTSSLLSVKRFDVRPTEAALEASSGRG